MSDDDRFLFRGLWVWNGRDDGRIRTDVLVSAGRIEVVGPSAAGVARDARVIEEPDATLIPGLVDGHAHLSFPESSSPTAVEDTPPEETVFVTMHNARRMIDAGFTSVIGAGSPKLRSEIVVRNEIDAGRVPGPRLLASTPTLTATGGLNDTGQLHQQRDVSAIIVDGPIAMRRAVRLCYREGVNVVKLNISGDDFFPRPRGRVTTMADDEVAAACEAAGELGLIVAAHARSAESVKRGVRHGVTIIHHADFCDEEALDVLEAAKDRVFVTPTTSFYHGLLHLSHWPEELLEQMMVREAFEANVATHKELHRRGVRMLLGSDYGISFMPCGTNAADVGHLVRYLGFTPQEALRAATYHGGLAAGAGGHNPPGGGRPTFLWSRAIRPAIPTSSRTPTICWSS
ncbi:amidohydrolase family protein [Novosphingobium sp. G106]|uniref:amidohydrolase family protein n=1 Tax=Novosphingobium sp. G106 TaxID=2849500 RepID=UPI0028127FA7|nr:amidohydrolase family protein [Novosphingobium sp. G106]